MPTRGAASASDGRRCCRRRRTRACARTSPPKDWRIVRRSARAWIGCVRSDSRLTTGTDDTAAIRSSFECSNTRAAIAEWYQARVRVTSSTVSRTSRPTSSPRIVTGCPPSCTTAISVELRVRADGFSKSNAAPWPASTFGTRSIGTSARSSTVESSSALRSSISRKCRVTRTPPRAHRPGSRRPRRSRRH